MLPRILIGTAVGWTVYIAVWLGKDFQGGLESVTQPLLAGIVSFFFVGIAFLLGLPLRMPVLRSLWNRIGWLSPLMTVVGIIAFFYAEELGLTHEVIHTETEEPVQGMNGVEYIISFLFIVFPWVNWPRKRSNEVD